MLAAEELADGDGAMLEAMAEAEGAAAGAEELVVPAEPPQAVRLSRAAAATPTTLKVVRLMVCIVVLLGLNVTPCRERDVRGADCFWLVGTCPWLVSHWVFGCCRNMDGSTSRSFFSACCFRAVSGQRCGAQGGTT
jgi:hypothetical protein